MTFLVLNLTNQEIKEIKIRKNVKEISAYNFLH